MLDEWDLILKKWRN